MTLKAQLVSLLAGLVLALFCGMLVINVGSTRGFLQDQLASHADDTATSLALTLTHAVDSGDLALAESILDATFDHGYYSAILLDGMQGQRLVTREREPRVEGVPQWLLRWVPLTTPTAEATVLSGWRASGVVRVTSHPGLAYLHLWESLSRMLGWMAVVTLVLGGIGMLLLGGILRPLRAVVAQAVDLAERRFVTVEPLPRTPELRAVVTAMNRMSQTLEHEFEREAERADALMHAAETDPVTGLGNRRHFERRLAAAAAERHGSVAHALVLLRVLRLDAVNRDHGYVVGDGLLRALAAGIEAALRPHEQRVRTLARIGGTDFALLIDGMAPTNGLSRLLEEAIGVWVDRHAGEVGAEARAGIGYASEALDPAQLLAHADQALSAAQADTASGRVAVFRGTGTELDQAGRDTWRRHLQTVLESRALTLLGQPVLSLHGEDCVHTEVLARIPAPGGEALEAGRFWPMAQSLHLTEHFDRLVLDRYLALLDATDASGGRYALNLSGPRLEDAHFLDDLVERLQARGEARRVAIEVPERWAAGHEREARAFARRLAALGGEFGLDHFGLSAGGLGRLRTLGCSYIKLDRTLTAAVAEDAEARELVTGLCRGARVIGVLPVAVGVEDEDQARLLAELGIEAGQGQALGEAVPLEGTAT